VSSSINSVVSLDHRQNVAVVIIDSPPVNALSQPVREGVSLALRQALGDPDVRAVVLHCAGRTFCAGADISEFGRPLSAPDLNQVFEIMEAASVPIVAALHGTALGGGLELALACHYRIAARGAKVGLPEVSLGLLPGAGGTQRTPRLVGVAAAIDLIAGGAPVDAERALAMGLIDRVVEGGDLLGAAVDYARDLASDGAPLRRARDLPVDLTPEAAEAAAEAYQARNPKLFNGFKAPGHILLAVKASTDRSFDAGLERERELFNALMASDESAAQRHIFFAERAVSKIPGLAADVRPLDIQSAAVIGAGTMGTGIAIALLSAGIAVTLIDRATEALDKAVARIDRTYQDLVRKGRLTEQKAQACLGALTASSDLTAVGQVDLIIEAVFERLELKQGVFKEIDALARPGAVLASNTSFLDLDAIASVVSRPQDVVGLHFFAPANIMRLLEVVRGAKTSDAVLVTAMALGRRLGKVAVLSGVCDGFIANRVMARRGEAADRLILEGAWPRDIDRVLEVYGFPMGSFAMMDLVGLDVIGWDREASAGRTVQEILCEAGHWGQKTGIGYYEYGPQGQVEPSRAAVEAIETIRARAGVSQRPRSDAELLNELLDPVVNESVRLLDEGIALRASDIDMALVAGYGWPVYQGGPMFWGDTVGLQGIVDRLKARIAAGEAIVLSPLLERYAAEGRRFVRD